MQMKKVAVMLAVLLCSAMTYVNMPSEAQAYPGVRIDYGETYHNVHRFWYVDLATLRKTGTSDNLLIKVDVSLETEQYQILVRQYQFIKQNGIWVFKWTVPFGGKHNASDSGPVWQSVSNERLANDVLYVVLNH